MAICLLKTMALPSDFWGEAICTAVYVLNRCPTKSLNNMTAYEAWHGRKPNVKHMRIFGCVAYVKLVGPGLTKLSDRSAKMIFIGYESGTKGYRFFNPATGKLVVGRDAIFDENVSWDWANAAGNTDQLSGEFIVNYEDSDSNSTIGDPEPKNSQLKMQFQKIKGVLLIMIRLHLAHLSHHSRVLHKGMFLSHHQARIQFFLIKGHIDTG